MISDLILDNYTKQGVGGSQSKVARNNSVVHFWGVLHASSELDILL